MADGQITNAPAPHPAHTDMPTLQYQDPPPETQETPNQEATPRPASIASLGTWKRGYALKIVVGAVLKNIALRHKHTAFKEWKHYTRLQTTTTNLTAHTVHASLAEALCTWRHRLDNTDVRHSIDNLACALTARLDIHQKTIVFNEWWHYSHNNITDHYPQMQLFLKGLASETLSITVPFPVTRQQLHEIIAKKTLVTPQNLSLGSMHHHVDAQNADLFYIEKNTTLQLFLLLNGGSDTSHPSNRGSHGPRKHAKPPTHQVMKFHIYVNGPDQLHHAIKALPKDKISHLKETLDPRVDLRPSFQTLYLQGEQLDDDLTLNDCDIIAGTTLQLLRTTPPSLCQLHDKTRHPDHLRQKLDPSSQKWIWVCHTNSACIIERHTQANAGAATNVITPHPLSDPLVFNT